MINHTSGNIFASKAEALVNPVNCVGVMGAGLALQFKNRYPLNYKAYALACETGQLQPGNPFIFRQPAPSGPRYIINFPTKRHWRDKSNLEDIRTALKTLAAQLPALGIKSIAVPALGAGLGGLDWDQVKAIVHEELAPLANIEVTMYEPRQQAASS